MIRNTAPTFDTRGNRTACQKGLRVRNSPTCTLSQNGYGEEFSCLAERRRVGDCCAAAARVVLSRASLSILCALRCDMAEV